MKAVKRLNKDKLFALKDSGSKFINRTGMTIGHQAVSSVLLADTLDVVLKEFNDVAFIGSYPEHFFRHFTKDSELERVFICGSSKEGLKQSEREMRKHFPYLEQHYMLCEEELWPFKDNSLDLVISNLSMQNSNDTSVAYSRILDSLKADGILAGHVYGKYTLEELKYCLYLAESERSGGFASHVYHTEDIATIGNLVDRVGYKLTSFTEKEIVEEFEDMMHLMDYLSSTGMSFSGQDARNTVLKDLFIASTALYTNLYGREYEPTEYEKNHMPADFIRSLDGKKVIPATFHLIQMLGWKDDPTKQPQPKKRGSGGGLDQFIKEIVDDDPSVADRIQHGVIEDDSFKPSMDAPLKSVSSTKTGTPKENQDTSISPKRDRKSVV